VSTAESDEMFFLIWGIWKQTRNFSLIVMTAVDIDLETKCHSHLHISIWILQNERNLSLPRPLSGKIL